MKKLLNTLYITTPDRYISLDGENVVISAGRQEIARVPLHNLERIMLFGGAGASPALMGKCVSESRELVFMSRSGKFLARVEGEVNGNVLLRRKQYRVADNSQESLEIARNIIAAKLYNSRWVLERTIRDHSMRIDTELFKEHLQKLLQGQSVALPSFNFKTGKREWNGHELRMDETTVFIIEGLHALNPVLLPDSIDKHFVFKL